MTISVHTDPMASIKQTKSGSYKAVVFTGPGMKGGEWRRQRQETKTFPTERAAKSWARKIEEQQETGTFVTPSKVTFGDYLTKWSAALATSDDLAPSTVFSYTKNIERHVLGRDIAGKALQKVTTADLQDLYAELRQPGANLRKGSEDKGLSPRTVAYIATILGRALKDAVNEGTLSTNPALRARKPKGKTSRRGSVKAWSADELSTYLRQSAEENDRDHPLWLLIASTGVRRGEALGLRVRDVDLEAATITITQTVIVIDHEVQIGTAKTDAGARTVGLDDRTVMALKAHRKLRAKERLQLGQGQASDEDLFFASLDGGWMHTEAVSKRFDRRAARYKLPAIGVHGLRHTWATLALLAGVNPRVVQQRLGHSNVSVTLMIYSHVTAELDKSAAETVAALFA